MKVSKPLWISVLLGLPLWIAYGGAAFGARGLFPDPFFRRYDLASEIVEATLIEVKPSARRIKDKMFEKFPDDSFMVAKIKVVKSWKGKLKAGQIITFFFGEPIKGALSDRERLTGIVGPRSIGESRLYYLRRIDGQLVGAGLFGMPKPEMDAAALEAMVAGKPETEVIKVMRSSDRFFYEEQLRKTGKIDRMAERPEWVPPPEGVEI